MKEFFRRVMESFKRVPALDHETSEKIENALVMLKNPHKEQQAIQMLAKIHHPKSAAILSQHFQPQVQAEMRLMVIEALSNMGINGLPHALGAYHRALSDMTETIRHHAVIGLSRLPDAQLRKNTRLAEPLELAQFGNKKNRDFRDDVLNRIRGKPSRKQRQDQGKKED